MSKKKITRLLNKAITLMQLNQHALAVAHLQHVLKIDPQQIAARMNLGWCEHQLGHHAAAAQIFHQLHEEQPTRADINQSAGMAYMSLGQQGLAFEFLIRALKSKPDDLRTLSCLTQLLTVMNRETEAIYYATEAIGVAPIHPDAYNNLGGCLMNLNRFQDAVTCFETALQLAPNHFPAQSNLGNVLEKMQDFDASIKAYRACLTLPLQENQRTEIKYKMSLPLLATGHLEEGWECFEYGLLYESPQSRNPKRTFNVPRWQGEDLKDKTLLVWREQGLGDEIDYLGLVPRLLEHSTRLILECDPRLVTLVQRSFPSCLVRAQSYGTQNLEATFQDYDYHLPLGSLPSLFLRQSEDFERIRPYLVPDPDRVLTFKKRLAELGGRHCVGICWRSSLNTTARNLNYTPISAWAPILTLPNITFVNLQYGECALELSNVAQYLGVHVVNFEDLDLKNDQDAVCALIAALDCVVSAGTAVACLTGAVGTRLTTYGHRGWPLLGQNFRPWSKNTALYLTHAETCFSFEPVLQQIASDLARDYP